MVITYYGGNSFLIQERLQAVKEKYLAKYAGGFNFWKFDLEENIDDLGSVLESQAMFAEKKLVFLRSVFSAAEDKWQNLESVLGKNNWLGKSEEVILIPYDFSGGEKSKKRLDFLKTLGEAKEFKNLDKPRLIDWCLKKASETGLKISRADLAYLIDGVGCDTHRVWNEIAKLAAYGNGIVTQKSIKDLASFDSFSNNFAVTDALLQRNIPLALKELEAQWQKNEEPVMVLGALVWQFRIMIQLAAGRFSSSDEAAQKLKLNPWVAKKALSALKNFTYAQLKNIYQNLADADWAMKTGAQDGREALADFIYGLLKA